jgi:hypothetical protein
MLFRPTRVIHVTSKDELDSALLSADQVIVEGDDQLLSYAAARASHDPELASVDVQIGGRSISVGRDAIGSVLVTGDGNRVSTVDSPGIGEPLPPPPARRTAAPARRLSFLLPLGLSVAFGLAALAIWYFVWPAADFVHLTTAGSQSPAVSAGRDGNIISPNPLPPPSPTSPGPNSVPQILQSLAWPAVAIAAILALFLIARQAIAGGRNVEISWKVTEKVSGRVVITKVRSRAKNARLAA